jgi:hypothetical protein
MLLQVALSQVDEGLAGLARLGHQMHLEEGPPPPLEEWPRVFFHLNFPQGRLVRSRWELADLGEGWYPTLEQAQHQDGVAVQMAGRGGVGNRNLPVVIKQS